MKRRNDFPRSCSLLALPAALAITAIAHADLTEAPVISMSIANNDPDQWWGYDFDSADYGETTGQGSYFEYGGSTTWDECDISWWHDLEVDPALGFGFSVTNNLTWTETYTLVAEVTVPGWTDGTLLGASVSGSVADTNFDGSATMTGRADGLLSALLDGNVELEVGQNVTASVDTLGGSAAFGPFSEGLSGSGATIVGPTVTNGVLRIELDFTLTAGDTATFSGGYLVEYVPAPAGLFALAGLAGLRRRRG